MRTWKNTSPDDGSIHCLGNGLLCAYGQGPNIVQIFGPPYSSPLLGRLTLDMDEPVKVWSQHEAGTAIWTHCVQVGGAWAAELTDLVDGGGYTSSGGYTPSGGWTPMRSTGQSGGYTPSVLPCLVRQVHAGAPVRFRLELNPLATLTDNGHTLGDGVGGRLCEIAPGAFFYMHYPYPRPLFYQVAWRGAVNARRLDDSTVEVVCLPGESWLYWVGGPEYPQAVLNAEAALRTPPDALIARTRAAWMAFTRARRDWAAVLLPALPRRERLLQAIDDVAVLIKAQQSVEGGVLAGHAYHLCYVRDQYGTARGLLAMGHLQEAQAILRFYWDIWQRHGRIHNAQAAGLDGVFHVHENDEVEITGYLIMQAFDLLDKTGNSDDHPTDSHPADGLVRTLWPMLEWAWEAQKRHLVGGMLPFNGDETYVAGGILPRTALNDGSAEATLLLIEGGERLLAWAAERSCWTAERVAEERNWLAEVKAAYRAHFWANGQLVANAPRRAALLADAPRFRRGVCERCHAEGRLKAIGWTERSAAGRYLCPRCLADGPYTACEPRPYVLQSVSLTPLYLHARLLPKDELRPAVEAIARAYRQSGRLPSRPDDGQGVSVGYDYGLLLYALTELGHPDAADLYDRTLSLCDATGAWGEYYVQHRPTGTRCRPWESGINLEALLHWAERGLGE